MLPRAKKAIATIQIWTARKINLLINCCDPLYSSVIVIAKGILSVSVG